MLGHLVGERGGQVGLGCQLQREAGQVGQFGVAGGDGQVDDPGQGRGEQLVRAARTAGWFGAPRVSSASSWVSSPGFPALPGGEPGGGGGEGGQLRGVGQVLLGEQVRPQRVPVAGPGDTAGAPTPPALRPRSG